MPGEEIGQQKEGIKIQIDSWQAYSSSKYKLCLW